MSMEAMRGETARPAAATDGSWSSTLMGLPACTSDTVSVSDPAQRPVDGIEQRSFAELLFLAIEPLPQFFEKRCVIPLVFGAKSVIVSNQSRILPVDGQTKILDFGLDHLRFLPGRHTLAEQCEWRAKAPTHKPSHTRRPAALVS
jgi:hypothetical protein